MSNLAKIEEYLSEKNKKHPHPKDDIEEIGDMFNNLIKSSQKLFWTIDIANDKDRIRENYSSILDYADKYIHLAQRTLEKPGINILEYGEDESHKSYIGGDLELRKIVIQKYLSLPYVEKVLTYQEDATDFFLIVAKNDMNDLSYQLTLIQIELFDKFEDYYFELRYVISGSFDTSSIPSNSVVHDGGGEY